VHADVIIIKTNVKRLNAAAICFINPIHLI